MALLTGLLTAAQLDAARGLIPGAYEPTSLVHPVTPAADVVPSTHRRATMATPYVVGAPVRPTTFLGQTAAILGDLGLIAVVMLVAAAVPAVVIWGIYLAGSLVLDSWRRL